MSQENVKVVQAQFEAWNKGDMDAWSNFLASDVTWRPTQDWPEQGPFVGRDAVMRQAGQLRETWDADALEVISDYIHGADRVVVRFVWRGQGHGPESNVEVTCIYTVRKGTIIAFEFFWDHAEALEALGLSEQDAHADS